MKKIIIGIIVILIAIGVVVAVKSNSGTTSVDPKDANSSSTAYVAVSETNKVSSLLSIYHNSELGFSVKYPTVWEKLESDLGVSFIMPIDKNQVSTIAKLQGDINVTPGKCAFPPVTTIKDRGTITVGANVLNTISMSNVVQGRSYFTRMYSLQKGSVCYIYSFSSITHDPASKNLTGSNITQAQNNNKAIIASSDAAFTDVVKSFIFVTGPAGQDETKAAPAPKVSATTTATTTKAATTTKK
ncbi:MAG: hypothetical protein M3Q80_00035 [bacterium]|nr:hypothetical protein [bacterium]